MEESSTETHELINKSSQLTNYAKSILEEAESQNTEIDRAQNLFKHTLKNIKQHINVIGVMSEKDFSLFLFLGAGTLVFIFVLFFGFF